MKSACRRSDAGLSFARVTRLLGAGLLLLVGGAAAACERSLSVSYDQ